MIQWLPNNNNHKKKLQQALCLIGAFRDVEFNLRTVSATILSGLGSITSTISVFCSKLQRDFVI